MESRAARIGNGPTLRAIRNAAIVLSTILLVAPAAAQHDHGAHGTEAHDPADGHGGHAVSMQDHGGHEDSDGHMRHDGHSESHGGGMRHDFSDAEHWAGMFDAAERDVWQMPSHVVELMAIEPGSTVADLGAGTGYFLPWLAEAVGSEGRVLGLDPEEGMVEWMAQRAEREGLSSVEARQVPFDDPGLAEGEADRILTVNTWHHIGDRVTYVGKLCRALAAGGALYVVDFTKDSPHGPPPHHRMTAQEVAGELAAGGLVVQILPEDLPHQWIAVGRRPAACPVG